MADLKQLARRIFRETLAAIDIPSATANILVRNGHTLCVGDARFPLHNFRDVIVIAVGKAAHAMADGLVRVLAPDVSFHGVVSAPTPPQTPLSNFSYYVGGHPLPNEATLQAAQAILSFLHRCTENSLVFFLLSGGGSSLMDFPLDPSLNLQGVREFYGMLVNCGASIEEINIVRKHFSAVKGGRLAVAAAPAAKITLAITDVPVGRESALASGPTLPDPSTCADVHGILQKYSLLEKLPASIRRWIESGKMPETPKQDHPAFAKARFSLLLGMHDLFHHAHRASEAEGFITCCDNSTDDWQVERAADFLLARLDDFQKENDGAAVALIADGEVSSPVTGAGIGGRNSAFVLACAEKIAGKPITVLSAGTDGLDGNSPAAGAVADGTTFSRARAAGMDPRDFFRRSDAYSFFKRLDDTVVTGPTGNNLRDLRIFLAESR
ncbi:MAG TPA: DUF4147 domain-containing protein [Terriglobales bacterium]|nr:DUF4147 domain-containing protein [Terriglobales bacterium]